METYVRKYVTMCQVNNNTIHSGSIKRAHFGNDPENMYSQACVEKWSLTAIINRA